MSAVNSRPLSVQVRKNLSSPLGVGPGNRMQRRKIVTLLLMVTMPVAGLARLAFDLCRAALKDGVSLLASQWSHCRTGDPCPAGT